jgi:hypothetical protein
MSRSWIAAALAALAWCLAGSTPSSRADSHHTAEAAMSSFDDALKKFTAEAAAAYGKQPADLQIMPPSEHIIGFIDENLGDLIAFQATSGELKIRGFANKRAAVLGKNNEYGALFQAAHALDPAKALPATEIAARIVWMLGPGHKLVTPTTPYPKYPVPPEVSPPVLEHRGNTATLRFYYLTFGMPGAPPAPTAAEVKVSTDYKAQLTTQPGP